MKKLFCMIALAAISFGSVFAAAPLHTGRKMNADTVKKEKIKIKTDTSKTKMKKDTAKM